MGDKDKYRKLVEAALKKSQKPMNESFDYGDIEERMTPSLERDLRSKKHSLGENPAFPESGDIPFDEEIVLKRFVEVSNRVKRFFDAEGIDNEFIMKNSMNQLRTSMELESGKEKDLEELAIKMVIEEFDIPEDAIDFEVELATQIDSSGLKKYNPAPVHVEREFENHSDIINASKEVGKRRLINAMTQGAAKKSSHMFHMVEEELTAIDPRLPNTYGKLVSTADYMYYIIDEMSNTNAGAFVGGIVNVELDGDKPKVIAKAVTFPILVHELVKGVMEVFATHGLPQDKQLQKFVLGKADFTSAEPWDMRLGPGLWERFTSLIPPTDFNLKHHIYTRLITLPVDEFNDTMKEIFAGTNTGKRIITDTIADIKRDFGNYKFDTEMTDKRSDNTKEDDSDVIDDPSGFDDIDLSNWLD